VSNINLPRSSKATSRVGFGCAYLTGGFEMRTSRRLVDIAYDFGFRHFDVAPLYGLGTAEDVLGASLSNRRTRVTIASKVGFPRPDLGLGTQFVRLVATPIRRFAPAILRRRERRTRPTAISPSNLGVSFVEQSLVETLRRLRTDYLDLFLLHDATAASVSDELLTYLDKARRTGMVSAFGIASTPENIAQVVAKYGNVFDVIQYSWSLLDLEQTVLCPDTFHIVHRTIMRAYEPFRGWLLADEKRSRRLSEAAGLDLSANQALSNVLLGAAVARNPKGIALVGTRRATRVKSNAVVIGQELFVDAGRRLMKAIAAEENLPTPIN
jgi:D-threo-aldose 1-dehydrogenase